MTGVEIIPQLADASQATFAGSHNVQIVTGDGGAGYPPGAPYDRVIATAGLREIPAALLEQTRPGARLLLPMSTREATKCVVRLFEPLVSKA